MQLEMMPTGDLIPYKNNPRKNDHAVEEVARAIKEFGFRVPVLIRGAGDVVDGHLRLKAAIYLGLEEVPVMRADDMSEAQVRAFRISINKVAELAKWDMSLLEQEMAAIKGMDYDVSLTGFAEVDIDNMLGMSSNPKDDEVPPLQEKNITQAGDLWLLGRHRLLCGDATDHESYKKLMQGRLAAMVFTDPPYNVDYEGRAGKIKNDKMSPAQFDAFLGKTFSCIHANISAGGGIYVSHADAGQTGISFRKTFVAAGFKLASCLVWRKNQFVIGRADYHWQHEPVLYGWKPGAPHRWYGGRKKTTVQDLNDSPLVTLVGSSQVQLRLGDDLITISGDNLQIEQAPGSIISIEKPLRSDLHPTMKPVALVERFLVNSSRQNDIILDSFGGSGTTLITCEKRGRVCMLLELDPRFADVIVRRWQDYTGNNAVHEKTGITFDQMAAG